MERNLSQRVCSLSFLPLSLFLFSSFLFFDSSFLLFLILPSFSFQYTDGGYTSPVQKHFERVYECGTTKDQIGSLNEMTGTSLSPPLSSPLSSPLPLPLLFNLRIGDQDVWRSCFGASETIQFQRHTFGYHCLQEPQTFRQQPVSISPPLPLSSPLILLLSFSLPPPLLLSSHKKD